MSNVTFKVWSSKFEKVFHTYAAMYAHAYDSYICIRNVCFLKFVNMKGNFKAELKMVFSSFAKGYLFYF